MGAQGGGDGREGCGGREGYGVRGVVWGAGEAGGAFGLHLLDAAAEIRLDLVVLAKKIKIRFEDAGREGQGILRGDEPLVSISIVSLSRSVISPTRVLRHRSGPCEPGNRWHPPR